MRAASCMLGLALASTATAFPHLFPRQNETLPNPFEGRKLFANPAWAKKLEVTKAAFLEQGDTANAAKVETVQNTGTFVWISQIASLPDIDTAISQARALQEAGEKQIIGLVLYNLPDRDCSAGESAGELTIAEDGLNRYKTEYVDQWVSKLSGAEDLVFAIVVEPDAVGNMVTNQGIEKCGNAKTVQEEALSYAVSKLGAFGHVHLYLDASHGGWLGWNDNLPLTAKQMSSIVKAAGNSTKIRGFSTNVSNYNPFHANPRENYTEWNNSWDENHYALSLAPFLEEEGLPSRFIIDQGRVHLPGARKEWGEWCNVSPAGFGQPATTQTNNTHVDSIVWVKPPGESDGQCGLAGAPRAGLWFDEYIQMLVKNSHPDLIGSV